jgi:hypothetical protein
LCGTTYNMSVDYAPVDVIAGIWSNRSDRWMGDQ